MTMTAHQCTQNVIVANESLDKRSALLNSLINRLMPGSILPVHRWLLFHIHLEILGWFWFWLRQRFRQFFLDPIFLDRIFSLDYPHPSCPPTPYQSALVLALTVGLHLVLISVPEA